MGSLLEQLHHMGWQQHQLLEQVRLQPNRTLHHQLEQQELLLVSTYHRKRPSTQPESQQQRSSS